MAENVFGKLENLEAPTIQATRRGVKLSTLTAKLKGTVDIVSLLGKLQQLGLVRIVYNPSRDEEPLVQVTERGRRQALELLLSW